MSNTTFSVRFTTVTRAFEVVVREREFRSEAARARFLDREEAAGRLVEVLGFGES